MQSSVSHRLIRSKIKILMFLGIVNTSIRVIIPIDLRRMAKTFELILHMQSYKDWEFRRCTYVGRDFHGFTQNRSISAFYQVKTGADFPIFDCPGAARLMVILC